MRLRHLAVLPLLLLVACASAPMAVPERDTQAKTFAPAADKAVVYIYRNETFGSAIKVPIAVNKRLIGDTVSHSYFRILVDPGPCEIQCKGETDSAASFTAEAGKVYFVWQEMKMGAFAAGCAMHQVKDDEGKAAVLDCKMLEAPDTLPK